MCVFVCWERFSLAGLDLVLLFVTVVVDVIAFVVAFFSVVVVVVV